MSTQPGRGLSRPVECFDLETQTITKSVVEGEGRNSLPSSAVLLHSKAFSTTRRMTRTLGDGRQKVVEPLKWPITGASGSKKAKA
ncbi:hypothetical protein ColTof4_10140 [Colletotrichum tofieldiae]|uniref:Uncharacterized protein n=1 Tax=Colletotrichum liriopes TaxID=708192 RepID=A0AA37GJK8_9PEZI|nr:hypothetical protein ColLi_04968 [Colletotrichum liriopes]GKT58859.1 hypothetical protein ColTof3_06198 [Colletotrichum tofieldiae]GKT77717.1 hypothetical protein ColTof4_10140 [Colletotrichum tofieldiae]GKT84989.1 hypothetical protein Ct61P_02839 [Colletotrichum tofieldiae]